MEMLKYGLSSEVTSHGPLGKIRSRHYTTIQYRQRNSSRLYKRLGDEQSGRSAWLEDGSTIIRPFASMVEASIRFSGIWRRHTDPGTQSADE